MAHPEDQAKLSLFDLPLDLLSQIFAYLIPSGQLLQVNTRYLANVQPAYISLYERQIDCRHLSWEAQHSAPGGCPPCDRVHILPLLLVHPIIYQLAISRLYADNTLGFPNLYTLQFFSKRFSLRARTAVRKMRLSACGFMQVPRHCCRARLYQRKRHAGVEVAEALNMFPGLSELTLVGVGPDVRTIHNLVDIRSRALPGIYKHEHLRSVDIWPLHCIALVARIVGAYGNETDAGNHGGIVKQRSGPLDGGRIFCTDMKRRLQTESTMVGTRIVRQGDRVVMGNAEAELVDVAAALQLAKLVQEKNKVSA